jgi:hypothetical protein
MQCPKQTRRLHLLTALANGALLAAGMSAAAQEDQPGSGERLQKVTCWLSPKGTMRVKSSSLVI